MSEDTEPEIQEKEGVLPKKKYQFIEDLPGVGPATSQKLRELGYHTVESLAMANARELEPIGVFLASRLEFIAGFVSRMNNQEKAGESIGDQESSRGIAKRQLARIARFGGLERAACGAGLKLVVVSRLLAV